MNMNKKAVATLVALICTVMLCPFLLGAKKTGSVKEITKPYLGVYQCEKILVGGEDRTKKFKVLELELKENGDFYMRGKEKIGKRFQQKGSYLLDEESGEFQIKSDGKIPLKKIEGKYEKGKITVTACLGRKMLVLVFSR